VGIGVERQADLRMPQSFHHHPGVYILRQKQRGAGVAEIMDADRGEFPAAQNRFERLPHVSLVQCSSHGAGEYQSALVPPASCLEALLPLPISVALQHLDGNLREGNGAAATFALGFNELQLSVDPLKRLTNMQLSRLKVNVRPPQAQGFSQAQPH